MLTDEPFNALNENGWAGQGSDLSVVADPTAPISPPSNVLQFRYGIGHPGGERPWIEYYGTWAAPVRETYFGFWWKPSDPWQNHEGSGVNKLAFMLPQTDGAGPIYIMMFHEGSDYTIQVEPEFPWDTRRLPPNVTATPVQLGVWHQVEWYVKYSTTPLSHDGVTKWWLDGVLQGVYTDLQMPMDAGFIEYQFAPIWGGVGETKQQEDFYWYDHAYISRAP